MFWTRDVDIAPSSTACTRNDGWRDKKPALDPESDRKSEISGIDSIGGRKVVDHDPEATVPERVLVLAIDRIVRIELVGGWVSDRSGTVTEQSSTSLKMLSA